MENQIAWADWVLVICTETYCRRFNGQEEEGKGLGARWEGAIITQRLYEQAGNNAKFIPVAFSSEDAQHVPELLKPTTRYSLNDEAQYDELYRRLTNQPAIPMPPLGSIRRLPRHDS
jgi:hypothetical protein